MIIDYQYRKVFPKGDTFFFDLFAAGVLCTRCEKALTEKVVIPAQSK
jgi:hypothetical protein